MIYTETLVEGPAMILEGRASALWAPEIAVGIWSRSPAMRVGRASSRRMTAEITCIVDKYPFTRRISIPPARYPG